MCHGKRGPIHQAYRDGIEDQLGALGLVFNAIALWTRKYLDAAVAQLPAEGVRSGTRTSPACPRSSTAT
ncbi:Tn3 family transposase [Streptomyces sp. NPDC001606]